MLFATLDDFLYLVRSLSATAEDRDPVAISLDASQSREYVASLYHHNGKHKCARMSYDDLCSSTKAKRPRVATIYCYAMATRHPVQAKDVPAFTTSIQRQIAEWAKTEAKVKDIVENCIIDIYHSQAHALTFVDLSWPVGKGRTHTSSLEAFHAPDKLYLGNWALLFMEGREPRAISFKDGVISVRLPLNADISSFQDALSKRLEPRGSTIDIWKLDSKTAGRKRRQWSGLLRILVSFDIKYMRSSEEFLDWLPMHIDFNSARYKLQYQMRDRQSYTYQDRAALNPRFFIKFEGSCIYCKSSDHKSISCKAPI